MFTLIELLAAMAVLLIIMWILLSFFNSAQKAWTMSKARAEVYENARVAMDLITRDLQCTYYAQDKVPFWHGAYADATWTEYRSNDLLAFVSATSSPSRDDYGSRLCEIKYQKYYSQDHSSTYPNDGWLMRSCTGDKKISGGSDNVYNASSNTSGDWGFYNNFTVARTDASGGGGDTVFTADSTSSEDYQRVIPHVVELSFTCYKKDGTVISKSTNAASPGVTAFPYSVKVSLTLMDKNAWNKWVATDDDPYHASTVLTASAQGTDEIAAAWNLRQQFQRTFTKTLFIGERGQKY